MHLTVLKRIFVAIAFLSAFGSAAIAEDRRVRINNYTSYTIVEFYGSNVSRDSWEEDILGSDVIRPGQTMVINFDDGSGYCMFDFKAVFSDGDVLTEKRVNICEITDYNYR